MAQFDFILVHFFEEKKFAVMKTKDALPKNILEHVDINTWSTSATVEVKWQDNCYPAHLLQFGGMYNKNSYRFM